MKSLIPILLMLASLTVMQSCSCDFGYKCDTISPMPASGLVGKWQYMRMTGGFAGIDSNVADRKWYLTLTSDNYFMEEIGGQPKTNGTYSISSNADSTWNLWFSTSAPQRTAFIRHDTLFMHEQGNDLYDYTCIRR